MPTEIEVPTEHLHEQVHHEAHHSQEKWLTWVALSTAVLAALAAVTALLAGIHANEAVIDRVKESNRWSYFNTNSVKAALVSAKMDTARLLDKPTNKKDQEKFDKYKGLQEELQVIGNGYKKSAAEHFERHEVLAKGVTMFQVAIAIAAIAAVMKVKPLWYMSMICGIFGTYFLIFAMTQMHVTPEPKDRFEEEEESSEKKAAAVLVVPMPRPLASLTRTTTPLAV